ncbi:MAG: HD domain-containing protein [Oscillospiraceae bacterium]
MITFEDIKNNTNIITYIKKADEILKTIGFTEHSLAHVTKCAETAAEILNVLGYCERTCELAKIAGFMHDIGNIINRLDHAQSGAVMAFRILDTLGMDPGEIADVISAIGNHDEHTAMPTNPISAALILADKSDVRRSRVRNTDLINFDIHDRVNYAAKESKLIIGKNKVLLILEIDTEICAVMDYFEIFLNRMILCKRAAEFLEIKFELKINNLQLL